MKLAGRRLGATLHDDAEGLGRAVVPDRDLEYYLELCAVWNWCAVRSGVSGVPNPPSWWVCGACSAIVRCACRDDDQRAQVAAQADLIVAALPESESHDARTVTTMAERVQDALRGRIFQVYTDRSGETRSI